MPTLVSRCRAPAAAACAVLALALVPPAAAPAQQRPVVLDAAAVQSRDGSRNNVANPMWGAAGSVYRRVAPAAYADGVQAMPDGPALRRLSNRVFDDRSQNLFSARGVTQWGFVWGQFLDHTFGLRDQGAGEPAPIPYSAADPLESFTSAADTPFARTPAAPGSGAGGPREQRNVVGSYIDASAVYGETPEREEWLREGPVDGDLSDNGPHLLLATGAYLPRADARGDRTTAPPMALDGRLAFDPAPSIVAGDLRANENVALTATHTLFAREHNRIVDQLPATLPAEERFQLARAVVIAEQQAITYEEFLPAIGVDLPAYEGYDPTVDAGLSNEFATVGFRAHSMVHGELEPSAPSGQWSGTQLAALAAQGISFETEEGVETLVIPLNVAFGNPGLVELAGLGPLLHGIGSEPQYRNDEQLDNQVRSVLFQLPVQGFTSACLDGPALPQCFQNVVDLGAIDVQRARDHGIPSYVALRAAYGLSVPASFAQLTGEASEEWPSDPEIDPANPLDDPSILDTIELRDADGDVVALGTPEADEAAVTQVRRTPLAARLKALYGEVGRVDAFVGMLSEPHEPGSELGALQQAMWRQQFTELRDGDRFFYQANPLLRTIEDQYGIVPLTTLGGVIEANTDVAAPGDVFRVAAE